MKCFYHGDNDGKCSAYWVRKLRFELVKGEFTLIPMQYSMAFPIDSIEKDEEVWIVDFSIQPNEMEKLLKITKNVIWIDHHKTAIDKYKNFPHEINGVRQSGIAGCELTFNYITQGKQSMPHFTALIGDRDVWKFKYGNESRHFHLGLETYDLDPNGHFWDVMEANIPVILDKGRICKDFRDGFAKSYVKRCGFEVEFEGHKCFAMNMISNGSEYFESVKDEGYDIFIPFGLGKNGLWEVSLYSEDTSDVDVSEIAKKYYYVDDEGEKVYGGGHKGAAGFVCKELPFLKAPDTCAQIKKKMKVSEKEEKEIKDTIKELKIDKSIKKYLKEKKDV